MFLSQKAILKKRLERGFFVWSDKFVPFTSQRRSIAFEVPLKTILWDGLARRFFLQGE